MDDKDKIGVYEAWRAGNMSEEEAREVFDEEDWEDVLQLARVETILADQPDPDTDPDDLFKD